MNKKVEHLTKDVINRMNNTIVVFDTDTTGFSRYNDRIVEFGALKLKYGIVIDQLEFLINPTFEMRQEVIDVHGITNEMLVNQPDERYYAPKIADFFKDAVYLVAHNASFDIGFIEEMFRRCGYELNCEYIDTLFFARRMLNSSSNKLCDLAKYLNIPVEISHRALSDVKTTVELLRHLAYRANNYGK